MRAGEPDKDDLPPPGESLAGTVLRTLRGAGPPPATATTSRRWREAAGLAALIAAAPVLTITGAHVLAGRERAQADRLETALAPRVARQVASEQARDLLAPLVNSPTLAATLDTLARGLPKDASIVRAERGGDGALRLELRTPDPDALRGALRRVPTLAVLREIGQQRSDAAMIVSYRGQTE